MNTIVPIETLSHFFSSKFPNVILVIGFAVLIYTTLNLETRVGHLEKDVESIDKRVLTLEVKTDLLIKDVNEFKKEVRDDLAEMRADIKLLLKQHP